MSQVVSCNLHNLLRVDAETPSGPMLEMLRRHFSSFLCNPSAENAAPDILIRPLASGEAVDPATLQMTEEFGFFTTIQQGIPTLGFLRKGNRIDLRVQLSTPCIIEYVPGAESRVYPQLLFLFRRILAGKRAALLHCAALEKAGRSLLVFGHWGGKKTMLALTLLNRGWNYVAEDKAVLANNSIASYQTFLSIKDHHLTVLPWLPAASPALLAHRRGMPHRARIRSWAHRVLPRKFWRGIDRKLRYTCSLEPTCPFPETEPLIKTTPTDVLILSLGSDFKIEPVSRDRALDCIVLAQEMMFEQFRLMEQLLAFYGAPFDHQLRSVLDQNIESNRFFKATLPHSEEIEKQLIQIASFFEDDAPPSRTVP